MSYMSEFLNDLPGELSDPEPSCSYCGDSGNHFQNEKAELEFCECEAGAACAQAHLDGKCYDDHEVDWVDPQARIDEMDYQSGVARGNLHAAERKIYGSQLADEFAMMDELNDYNNGLI